MMSMLHQNYRDGEKRGERERQRDVMPKAEFERRFCAAY